MNGLMADLMVERLRTLQVATDSDKGQIEVSEMIDIVHSYLT
jgi:hypothetical protein